MLYVFTITLENIVTGETAVSMCCRGDTEQDARDHVAQAFARKPEESKNLRFHSATKRFAARADQNARLTALVMAAGCPR